MNAKTEVESSSGLDTAKLLAAVVILIGGIVGFYILEAQALWVRLLLLLAVVGVAVFVAYQTALGRSAWGFVVDARTEVRKVVWPTRQETLQTSLAIFAAVLVTALFLWGIDSILFWLVALLTGQGG
ncbi:MAG: preprotein translocase subunit SecE [Gammaproteobacteria bacterium]|jgi:preprotein translocase subunit SecE